MNAELVNVQIYRAKVCHLDRVYVQVEYLFD
jgi:hypothetical protein